MTVPTNVLSTSVKISFINSYFSNMLKHYIKTEVKLSEIKGVLFSLWTLSLDSLLLAFAYNVFIQNLYLMLMDFFSFAVYHFCFWLKFLLKNIYLLGNTELKFWLLIYKMMFIYGEFGYSSLYYDCAVGTKGSSSSSFSLS